MLVLSPNKDETSVVFDRAKNKGDQMLRTVATFIVLFSLWLLMSGVFKPLLIGLGLTSVLVVIFVVKRMDAQDGDQIQLHLSPLKSVSYFFWLMVEIARANWAVAKIILSPKMPIHQHLFSVPCTQESDLGQVIYATSITLTPGTITVETEGDHFLVHAVAYSDDDIAALADMDGRVSAIETQGGS